MCNNLNHHVPTSSVVCPFFLCSSFTVFFSLSIQRIYLFVFVWFVCLMFMPQMVAVVDAGGCFVVLSFSLFVHTLSVNHIRRWSSDDKSIGLFEYWHTMKKKLLFFLSRYFEAALRFFFRCMHIHALLNFKCSSLFCALLPVSSSSFDCLFVAYSFRFGPIGVWFVVWRFAI